MWLAGRRYLSQTRHPGPLKHVLWLAGPEKAVGKAAMGQQRRGADSTSPVGSDTPPSVTSQATSDGEGQRASIYSERDHCWWEGTEDKKMDVTLQSDTNNAKIHLKIYQSDSRFLQEKHHEEVAHPHAISYHITLKKNQPCLSRQEKTLPAFFEV